MSESNEEMMTPIPDEVFQLLDGDTHAPVSDVVAAWLRSSGENRQVLEDLKRIWAGSVVPASPMDWADLEGRLDSTQATDPIDISGGRLSARRAWPIGLRAAAVLLVGIGLGLLGQQLTDVMKPESYTRVVVPAGSHSQVDLPGGVSLLLGYATELEYLPSANVREITLRGEAYIRVPDGTENNLIVHTEAGDVRDLGTEFNIRARNGMTSVAVTDGRVALTSEYGEVLLTAGQESSVAVGGAPVPPRPVNLGDALGWMQGRLTFYDQPLSQVVDDLQYRYGVHFQVTDPSLRATNITAKIPADASPADAATVICMAVQARCERNGDQWVISK